MYCSTREPDPDARDPQGHVTGEDQPAPLDHLPPAWPDRAAWGTAPSLRAWQTAALGRYFAESPRDFLAVATPGAGKTTFALTVAAELLGAPGRRPDHRRGADRAPQDPVGRGRRAGRHPDRPDVLRRARARPRQDYVGVAVTYAGVAVNPLAHRIRTERFKTLVILDEVHHAGDALSWGEARARGVRARRTGGWR